MPERPFERWLAGQARWAQQNPWLGLALIAAACALSWFGIINLKISGIGDMFDADSPGAARYREWSEMFGNAGEVVVLIDTGEHGEFSARAEAATHALGESLRGSSAVQNVVWGLDRNAVSPKMLLTLPADRVAHEVKSLAQVKPLLVSDTPAALLQAGMAEAVAQATATTPAALERNDQGEGQSGLAEAAELFNELMRVFTRRMNTPASEPVDLYAAMSDSIGGDPWQFMRSANGRLLVVRARLREAIDDRPGYDGSLAAVRRHLDAVRQRFDGVPMGLTGLEPSRSEAEAIMRTAAQRGVGAALAALWVLTALAWRDVRRPVAVTVAVGVGLWWTLGWSGAVAGVVHPLAGVALLAGVGLTLFGALAWCGESVRRLGTDAAAVVGPGVVITAGVWGAAGLVTVVNPWIGTLGIREAGKVTVGAAVVVVVTVVWVVPVLSGALGIGHGNNAAADRPPRRENLATALRNWAQRSRRGAGIFAAAILIVVGVGAWRADYRDVMTGFLPAESEGAEWQRRAVKDGGELGLAVAVVATDMEQATEWAQQLRALPEVARVTGIARMVPEDLELKRELLAGLGRQIGEAARSAAAPEQSSDEAGANDDLLLQVNTARFGLSIFGPSLPEAQQPLVQEMDRMAAEFLASTQALGPETRDSRLAALQNEYADCRQRVGRLLQALLEDRDLTLDDLGDARPIFSPWISSTNTSDAPPKLTLKAYPATKAGGWPTAAELSRFLGAVRGVTPEVTGELERFAAGTTALRRDFTAVTLSVLLCAAAGLGMFSRSWRIGSTAALPLIGSGLAQAATIGGLGQPVGVIAGAVWPLTAILVLAWTGQLAGAARRTFASRQEDSGVAEAFGLTLALGFVLAAGLRGAQAPGITAVAIGVCVGAVVAGLLGLFLIKAPRPAPRRPAYDTAQD
ncbi:MAG: hypothetical protein AAF333_07365 [Planctomycetota bacterium]